MYASEQFHYRFFEVVEGESSLPLLRAEGLGGQLYEFATKGPTRATDWAAWLGWIPAIALGIGGWFVAASRYLTTGWRTTRVVVLLMLLAALLAGHVGILCAPDAQRIEADDNARELERTAALANLPHNQTAAKMELRLKQARLLGTNETGVIDWTTDFGSGPTNPVILGIKWEVVGLPPGIIALTQTYGLKDGGPSTTPEFKLTAENVVRSAIIHDICGATNEVAACLPEVRGYQVRTATGYGFNQDVVDPALAAKWKARPHSVTARLGLWLLEAKTTLVAPLSSSRGFRVDELKLQIVQQQLYNPPHTLVQLWKRLPPSQDENDGLLSRSGATPDLMIVRNPRTREAFILSPPWEDHSQIQPIASLLSPTRRMHVRGAPAGFRRGDRGFYEANDLTYQAERVGFNAAWLAESELLCVRLTLVGFHGHTVQVENFQLEPAKN